MTQPVNSSRVTEEPAVGERALRDMRSLWPVPAFVLTILLGLLFYVDSYAPHLMQYSAWIWGVLIIIVFVFLIYNRKALTLAQDLKARSDRLAASRDRLAALNTIGSAIAADLELEPILHTLCVQTTAMIRAERVAVALRDRPTDAEQIRAAHGFPSDTLPSLSDLHSQSNMLSAPISSNDGALLGTLYAVYSSGMTISREDREMLGAIVTQATVAITNARLYEQSNRRGEDLRSLVQQVSESVTAADNIDRITALVAEQTLKLVDCDGVGLFLLDEARQTLLPSAWCSAPHAAAASALYREPLLLSTSALLRTILTAPVPMLYEDVSQLGETGRWSALEGVRALVAAPLRGYGRGTMGLLLLHWETDLHFGEENIPLVSALAGFAAVSVQNARLAAATREAQQNLSAENTRLLTETRQREEELRTLMQRFGEALAVGLDRERVASLVVDQASRMISCDRVVFFSAERSGEMITLASSGAGGILLDEDRLKWRRNDLPFLENILARSHPVVISDVAQDGRLGDRERALLRNSGIAAMLLAPLRGRGETTVGLLGLFWTETAFTPNPEQFNVAQALAAQAAVALENARLYQALEQIAQTEQQRANELDATFRSLGDGVVLCDASGRLLSVNRAGQAILGSDGSFLGQDLETWASRIGLRYPSGQPVPPGAVPLAQTLKTGQPAERTEFLIQTGVGQARVIELTATPIRGVETSEHANGIAPLGGAVAVFRDITALKDSQRQENAANTRVESLLRISQDLNATLDLDQIHRVVAQGALDLLPESSMISDARALLYSFDGDGRPLTLLATASDAEKGPIPRATSLRQSLPFTVPFDTHSRLIWQVYVSREIAYSPNWEHDLDYAADQDRLLARGAQKVDAPIRSVLALPLLARDFVSGHLLLTSSLPSAFDDPRLVDALRNLTALAVIARVNARLYGQMKQRADELDALWKVGQAIASKLELGDVVDTLTDRVRAVVAAELCTLSLYETDAGGARRLSLQGHAVHDALRMGESDVRSQDPCDLVTYQAAQTGEVAALIGQPNLPFTGTEKTGCKWRAFAGQSGKHSVLAVPLKYGNEILGALTVYTRGEQPFHPDQIKLLNTLASLAVAVVRNARSFAHEQNIAETLQASLLPEGSVRLPGLEIAEQYYPASLDEARIGGDYYDFIPLGPHRLAVVIGDISGKGLAAAVYTAMAKYTLRAFAAQEMPPAEVVTRANIALARYTTGEIFSTMFYGVLDMETATLTYVNAGHEPPQLARAEAGHLSVSLLPTGPMLGAFPESEYEQVTIPLAPGDIIALYTDGLSDVRAPDGLFFGEAGIRASLQSLASKRAEEAASALYTQALNFAAEGHQRDDIALLVVKVLPS